MIPQNTKPMFDINIHRTSIKLSIVITYIANILCDTHTFTYSLKYFFDVSHILTY